MSVMIRVGGTKAIFRDGAWLCCSPALEVRLNGATAEWIAETGGPGLRDRDPERSCAAAVSERLGGVIVRHVPARNDRVRGMFLSRRQMDLPF